MSDGALTERSARKALEAKYVVCARLVMDESDATRFASEDTAYGALRMYHADHVLQDTENYLVQFNFGHVHAYLRLDLLREWKTAGEDTEQ